MRDFRELDVWTKSHQFALDAYNSMRSFPKEETYGLTSQIKRSAVSIPSNIAEGCGRNTQAELAHFFQISMGSASEVEYQLLFAKDVGYLPEEIYSKLSLDIKEIKKMLASLIARIRRNLH